MWKYISLHPLLLQQPVGAQFEAPDDFLWLLTFCFSFSRARFAHAGARKHTCIRCHNVYLRTISLIIRVTFKCLWQRLCPLRFSTSSVKIHIWESPPPPPPPPLSSHNEVSLFQIAPAELYMLFKHGTDTIILRSTCISGVRTAPSPTYAHTDWGPCDSSNDSYQ